MRHLGIIVAIALSLGVAPIAQGQPISIVNNQPGAFDDISVTGTALNLNDDDETVITLPVGNALFPAGTLVVANNGGIALTTRPGKNDLSPENAAIPSISAFTGRQSLLAYWDDLKGDDFVAAAEGQSRGKPGNVYYKVTGSTTTVQWSGRSVTDSAVAALESGTVTFQIKIFGGVVPVPGAIYAQMIYDDVQQSIPAGGVSATIGFQKGEANSNDYQWSFNAAGAVSDGTVLSVMHTTVIPAVSDAGNVALILLILTAGVFVFRRGRLVALNG